MTLSLVIPAYNEEDYIGPCLGSVFAQKELPDEVIVVDNNCTDRTAAIARRFPGVRILREPRQGMIPARNAGYDAATMDIIARTDADTMLPTDWVRRVKENFARYPIHALTGPGALYDHPFVRSPAFFNAYFAFMKLAQGGEKVLIGCNMAITREMWWRVRMHLCMDDTLVHEDLDVAKKILAAGGRIRRDSALVCYTSARRAKDRPFSFFVEYPIRFVKTCVHHRRFMKTRPSHMR